jgi:hypothetical protein
MKLSTNVMTAVCHIPLCCVVVGVVCVYSFLSHRFNSSFVEGFATTFSIEDYQGRIELRLAEESDFTGIIAAHLCYSLTNVGGN